MTQRTTTALTGLALIWLAVFYGCAPKRVFVPVSVPAWDLVEEMPLVPSRGLSEGERTDFEVGWRWLRRGELAAAADELIELGRKHPDDAEVATALGFLELRAGSEAAADRHFDAALRASPRLGPALGGRFLVALAREDEEQAYRRILELEEVDPTSELVDRYRVRLQVNVAESRLRAARSAYEDGRFEEAAEAYARALEVAPEVGALHIEAAEAELSAGNVASAVRHAERAAALEPRNAAAHEVLAEALYESGELERAVRSMRRALELRPGDEEAAERLARLEAEYRERNLPEEYADIPSARRLTREQLAALLYIELRGFFDALPDGAGVIATDISDSWASAYILPVVRAGVLEVFANHTFQPQAFVDRSDLAGALASAYERFAPRQYADAIRASRRSLESFPDLSRDNVGFAAAALGLSRGWLETGEGGAFEPRRWVNGEEAVSAVRALATDMTR